MRSRISWFDKTLFRKDLTRYAPAWVLYALCLLGGSMLMFLSDGESFWYAPRVADSLTKYMPFITMIYAAVVAVLLFGDLYDSRMCYCLHALPLRRETNFVTHTLAGVCYALIPELVFALVSLPMLLGTQVVDAWQLAPLWVLGATLEYLLFFGMAVLCVFCAGNKLVALLLYAGLNGFTVAMYVMIDTFYTPMLYGVVTPSSIQNTLSPLAQLVELTHLTEFENYPTLLAAVNYRPEAVIGHYTILWSGWGRLAVCGAIGVAFLVIALLLYKKRPLEKAGDALAVKALEPVISVLFGLAGIVVCFLALTLLPYQVRTSDAVCNILMAAGLCVGWFAGRMLLRRSFRVFTRKNVLGLAALAACLGLSLGLTYWDVFKIDDRVPEVDEVESILVSNLGGGAVFEDPEDIAVLLNVQKQILQDRVDRSMTYLDADGNPMPQNEAGDYVQPDGRTFYLMTDVEAAEYDEEHTPTLEELSAKMEDMEWMDYREAVWVRMNINLKNGRTMSRRYHLWSDSAGGNQLRTLLGRWELLEKECFSPNYRKDNTPYEELDLDDVLGIHVTDGKIPKELVDRTTAESLLAALRADCEAGNLTQDENLHPGYFSHNYTAWSPDMAVVIQTETGYFRCCFYPDSKNTIAWCQAMGVDNFLVSQENRIPIAYPDGGES